MKKIILGILFTIIEINSFSQSIYKSAESKSGILVGTQKINTFAGVSYNNASKEFSFNYKQIMQSKKTKESKKTLTDYPDFSSLNGEISLNTEDSKTNLISDKKWQGGIDIAFTWAYTWDKQKFGSSGVDTIVKVYYVGKPGTNYVTIEDCANDSNSTCTRSTEKIIYKKPKRKKQNTFFLSTGNNWARINNASIIEFETDTSYINLKNPGQNKFFFDIGYNQFRQVKNSNFYYSWALTANNLILHNSSRGLKEGNLTEFKGLYLNVEDTTVIMNFDKQENYYIGNLKNEFLFIPRFDLFVRYDFGKKKPFIGIVGSLQKNYSTNITPRNNFAFGLTISPPSIPDQLLFAILYEFIEDSEGKMKKALTFRASFPILFE